MTKALKLCDFIHVAVHGCLKPAIQDGVAIIISRTVHPIQY